MKKLLLLWVFLPLFAVTACGSDSPEPERPDKEQNENQGNNMESDKIKLTAGNKTFTATLADNSSGKALKELLAEGDITIDMRDYANMEKVGPLGKTLPRNDEQITTSAGDLILYHGNQFVIYYAPNTYSLTRLGKIENTTREELLSALGNGNVRVILSIN